MNNIILKPSKDVPYFPGINFDYDAEICELYAESYMEEPYKFYKPLMDWIKEYFTTKKHLNFEFKLTYFNTSTSKMIVEILEILRKNKDLGNEINVNWHITSDDTDLELEVKDFENDSEMPITIIKID